MGVWAVLNRPLPVAAARDAVLRGVRWAWRPVPRAVHGTWHAVTTPLVIRGWKPPVTAMLAWNVVWTAIYLGAAGGTAFWAFRTDEYGDRLASIALLEERMSPVWREIANDYVAVLPRPTLPLPTGNPDATLAEMLRSNLVSRAYYLSPDRVLTMRQRVQEPKTRATREVSVTIHLATWRPDVSAQFPAPLVLGAEGQRLRAMRRGLDRFVTSVLQNGLPGKLGDMAGFAPHPANFYVKGNLDQGVLGFIASTGTYGIPLQALALRDLGGLVQWPGLYQRHVQFHPNVNLPAGAVHLVLEATDEGMDWADAEGNRRHVPVLALLLGMVLVRGTCAARDLRAILNQRAIALAQSDFVSAVSHEMRTPLTTIQLYAEMLAQDVVTDPAKRRHYLATIAGESERLGRLIENVLDYARISGRRKAYRFEPVDVRELLAEALTAVQGPLELAGLTVELHAPVPVIAPVDRDALVQAMINLLANAAKYAAAGRRVVVSALPAEGGVALAVQDFGPGIAAEDQAKVFEPFYRVGSELTRTTTGSGLGLALVAETAKAHGGRVELESVPGRGSEFRLVLPQQPTEG
ncbi:MAG: hypothetical protein JWM80_6355 [Cyanobacteria bacterium RYN_339]|nr:hypothetical protein [Cyanobacteria bacterium RYN_339]